MPSDIHHFAEPQGLTGREVSRPFSVKTQRRKYQYPGSPVSCSRSQTQIYLKFGISKHPFLKRKQKGKRNKNRTENRRGKRKKNRTKNRNGKRKENRKESIRGKERKEEVKNSELPLSSFFLLFFLSHREGLSSVGHQVDFCVRVLGNYFFKGFPDTSHRGEEGIPGIFFREF